MTQQTNYEQDAERYYSALDTVASAWILAHKPQFKELVEFATATYYGEVGGFRRRMELLQRLAADAANFPSFSDWLRHEYPHQEAA